MGLFDAAKNKVGRWESYKQRYEGCSDEELKRLYTQSSGDKKIAIGMLLKERGIC